ncbi:TetR/AcrR family transcriptional regulator [Bifidobacterium pullorum subsp. saeculare]|uniref:TetR/AcrR family transcriptional regulator n=1 Tax=Bifidobacterium pullorum subsp. saeculare TaxID=78257 RepID=A0A938WYX3_9BIFI|nr:TetR/AcrR family transcriptional regulator [Bifidobacterium pullorum]MBM6700207.1 TetR/AcrR family transcriptional regulator [Bifidobacterium pullorum subsp. saeculare]
MTSLQRREQLIAVGRALFAAKGFEAVSVEEIASHAKVSKPIVYEHFGGKEGLYAVVVDREMQALTGVLTAALSAPTDHPRQIVERTALALLTYIEENAEGFRVLSRDSPSTDPSGSFSSLLGDVSMRVEDLLTSAFRRQKLSTKGVPYYAQMLVGMTVFTGQYWAARPKVSKEQLAAYIVDLAWHGLSRLDSKPTLVFEAKAAKRARKAAAPRGDGAPEEPATRPSPDAGEPGRPTAEGRPVDAPGGGAADAAPASDAAPAASDDQRADGTD